MGLFSKKKETEAPANGHAVTLDDGISYIIAQTVDCLGDNCPRPQLLTKKAVGGLTAGGVVEVILDNPDVGRSAAAHVSGNGRDASRDHQGSARLESLHPQELSRASSMARIYMHLYAWTALVVTVAGLGGHADPAAA